MRNRAIPCTFALFLSLLLAFAAGPVGAEFKPNKPSKPVEPWKAEKKAAREAKRNPDFSYTGAGALLLTEYMPRFRGGGIQVFQAWVQSQVVYPEAMRQGHVEGTVVASFVVTKDGLVRGVEILRTPHERLGLEVDRVIKLSKSWTPGYDAQGQTVDVRQSVAVRFKL